MSHAFWIDGPYSTTFAAQPLANKGIIVLQLSTKALGTAEEGPQAVDVLESAIDYLDKKGLIDRNNVGLVGFSRTCYHVKFALTHSRFHFAAASIADGVDGGYFQYIVFANENPFLTSAAESLVGGAPFGEGLSLWNERSPGFLLQRVETPLEIQAIGPTSVVGEWEWFSGLSRLNKPVDLRYIPTGTHILEKPWDRMASQQTTVDWFQFWLKNEQDPDPTKAEQYVRWGVLRQKAAKVEATGPTFPCDEWTREDYSWGAPRRESAPRFCGPIRQLDMRRD